MRQEDITFSGHAIECRINAEHPATFAPSPGQITYYHPPGGLGVRVDSAVYQGYSVPPYYDSLIGKLIVHGRDRVECLMRLRRALDEFVVDGVRTTIPLFQDLVAEPDDRQRRLRHPLAGGIPGAASRRKAERCAMSRAAERRPRRSSRLRCSCAPMPAASFRWPNSADDPTLYWVEPRLRGVLPLDRFHRAAAACAAPSAPGVSRSASTRISRR